MDKEVEKEVLVPQKTVIKIGRTEYEIYGFYSDKNTLFDKLLRLMIKDLDKRN